MEFFFVKNFVKGKCLFDGLFLIGRIYLNGVFVLCLKLFLEKYNDEILSR